MGKPRVVIVVESSLVVGLEKSMQALSPVNILCAADGVAALELIRRNPPDLIIMDLDTPLLDGVACCTLLKADPALRAIPVVMLTSEGGGGERERALRAGCDDFLAKPLDQTAFLAKIQQYTANVARQDVRVACQIPLLFLWDREPIAARAVDIGEGGIFIETDEPARRDTPLKLAFYLPTANPFLLEAGGRVVWLNSGEDRVKPELPQGFGVEFRGLDDREFAALKLYLDVTMNRMPRGADLA